MLSQIIFAKHRGMLLVQTFQELQETKQNLVSLGVLSVLNYDFYIFHPRYIGQAIKGQGMTDERG